MPKFAFQWFLPFCVRITSQAEHTKKRNTIDSESKSVKRNADHQNRLTVYFYMLF